MKLKETKFMGILCAILSGILLSLGFPKLAFFYAAPFAFIPLFIVLYTIKGKKAIFLSLFYIWIFGFTFQIIAFYWISQPIVYFSSLPDDIGYSLYILISALTSLYFIFLLSPMVLNLWLKQRYQTGIPIIFLAIFMTSLEILIPRFFDWTIGQIFNNIYFWQLSSLFGFNTGTFFILLTNLSLAYAFTQYKNTSFLKKTFAFNIFIWIGIFIFGFLRIHIIGNTLEHAKKIRIAYIQPNFTFQELASKRIHAKNASKISLNTVLKMSSDILTKSTAHDNKRPDLLLWPESVSPDLIFMNPNLQNIVKSYSELWQVPILLQDIIFTQKNPLSNSFEVWSVSKIMTPNGLSNESFEKWVPIPFGEAVPFEDKFPKLGTFYRSIIANSSKVESGKSFQALNVQNKFYVAPLICFDSIYQKLPYLQAQYGKADLFVNQANFMWMVNSIAGLVFGYLDRARGVENARSMILVSNTGPTIAFDPLGRIIWGPTELMSSDSGFFDVPLYDGKTLFSYVYYWPILILGLLGAYIVFLRLRSRSS